jgi:formate-dependent nitrite reductase membrane component NrfD
MEELMVVGWMLFSIYVLVLLAIMADLWSGVRKAKARGELRTSTGYRRTVDKIARYYNALIVLTIMDGLQVFGIWYLDGYYGYKIPIFPIVTLLGAIGICVIEFKSIYEKSEEKTKEEIKSLANLLESLLKSGVSREEIAKAVDKYLNK